MISFDFFKKKKNCHFADFEICFIGFDLSKKSEFGLEKIRKPFQTILSIDLRSIKKQIEAKIHDLYDEQDNSLIHGDLCFSTSFPILKIKSSN